MVVKQPRSSAETRPSVRMLTSVSSLIILRRHTHARTHAGHDRSAGGKNDPSWGPLRARCQVPDQIRFAVPRLGELLKPGAHGHDGRGARGAKHRTALCGGAHAKRNGMPATWVSGPAARVNPRAQAHGPRRWR